MKNQITQVYNISSEDLKIEIADHLVLHINEVLQGIMKDLRKPKEKPEFLTSKEAAKILKISLPTLYEWRKKRIVIGYRIANKIRYKQSEIESSLKRIEGY